MTSVIVMKRNYPLTAGVTVETDNNKPVDESYKYHDSIKRYMMARQVAEYCGLSLNTIRRYRQDGRLLPPDAIIGDKIPVWSVERVHVWNAHRRRIDVNTNWFREEIVNDGVIGEEEDEVGRSEEE
jgi:predicted DNA-binding transcriptional regulator AlpA